MLVALDALGSGGSGFDALFDQFQTTLLAHAAKEEKGEFAGLREKTGSAERTAMAAAVRVASTLAPTHPHPGLESGPRSMPVGTPLAMIARARTCCGVPWRAAGMRTPERLRRRATSRAPRRRSRDLRRVLDAHTLRAGAVSPTAG
jgi:hypothetical protein